MGYRTFVDAKLYRERNKNIVPSGKTEVPISEAPGDPSGSANVKVSGGHWSLRGTETTGERIHATCFRRVRITLEKKGLEGSLKSSQRQLFATTCGKDEKVTSSSKRIWMTQWRWEVLKLCKESQETAQQLLELYPMACNFL